LAIFNDLEDLQNEINTPHVRENCEYYKELDYTLNYNLEELINIEVTNGELPPDLELSELGIISGIAISPNEWNEEIQNYILAEYSDKPDDFVPFEDAPDLTIGLMKTMEEVHLTGQNYGLRGLKAYYKDNSNGGVLSQFKFEITLYTKWLDESIMPMPEWVFEETSKWFYIMIVPNNDPKTFIIDYGNSNNNLVNDNIEIISPIDYIEWRESQGHFFDSGCNY
jgi:hypothetical protein